MSPPSWVLLVLTIVTVAMTFWIGIKLDYDLTTTWLEFLLLFVLVGGSIVIMNRLYATGDDLLKLGCWVWSLAILPLYSWLVVVI